MIFIIYDRGVLGIVRLAQYIKGKGLGGLKGEKRELG